MRLAPLASFQISTAAFFVALVSCSPTSADAPRTFAFEFAEVGTAGTTRHLYDASGNATELIVASALALTGNVTGIIPGGGKTELLVVRPPEADQVMVGVSQADSDKMRDWTSQRVDREAAIIVGDQILARAHIRGALSGSTALPIPGQIRSADLKVAIDHARKLPR